MLVAEMKLCLNIVLILLLFSCGQNSNLAVEDGNRSEDSSSNNNNKETSKLTQREKDSIEEYNRKYDSVTNSLKEPDKDIFFIPGVWHACEGVGSGYCELFQFFTNGSFVFNNNQMSCDQRLISYSGSWSIAKDMLTLNIKEKKMLVGGKLVSTNGEGSCGSDSMLIDTKEKVLKVSPPGKEIIKLSKIYYEKELGRKTMLFNKSRYWRINIRTDEFNY
jgi:hypothetical protein